MKDKQNNSTSAISRKTAAIQRGAVLFGLLVLLVGGSIAVLALSGAFAREQEKAVIEQDGILVEVPGERQRQALLESIDPETGESSYPYAFKTPEHEQKNVKIHMNLDGYDETYTYTVVWEDGRATPLQTSGANTYGEIGLTRIGDSNRFVIDHVRNIYLVDLEKETLEAFLPYEADGLTYAGEMEDEKDTGGLCKWATAPHISPDGSLVVYQTSRGNALSIRVYDFRTNEDRLLAAGHGVAGGVVWNGNKSIVISRIRELYEVSLPDGAIKLLYDTPFSLWAGAYPYILLNAQDNSFYCMDAETGTVTNFPLKEGTSGVLDFRMHSDPAVGAAFIAQWTGDEYIFSLFSVHSGTMTELLRVPEPFSYRNFQWTTDGHFLLSGTEDGRDATYEIAVTELLTEKP